MKLSHGMVGLTILALTACELPGYVVPDEHLVPTPSGTLYIGDNYDCKSENRGTWRYTKEHTLSFCEDATWYPVRIEGR